VQLGRFALDRAISMVAMKLCCKVIQKLCFGASAKIALAETA
jgi:hypothetical protein